MVKPRIVVVIDEFQMLFADQDTVATTASDLIIKGARLFRACGIHFILASQTIGSGGMLGGTTGQALFAQIPVRLALKNSLAESHATLGLKNDAASHIRSREAIVNLDYGELSSNRKTTIAYADDAILAELRTAYDLVPKATEVQPGRLEPFSYECRVRVNLGIGIEIQADALRSAKSLDDAIAAYQEAVDLISPCQTAGGGGGQSGQSGQSGGQGQSGNQSQSGGQGQSGDDQQSGGSSENPADENKSRVQKKKEDTEKEQQGEDPNQNKQDPQNNQDPKPNPSSSPTPSNSPTSDPYEGENSDEKQQRQKLEDQNSGRAKERRDQTDDKRSGNPNGAW